MELYERIAEVCHEANRVYCQSIGDNSQLSWDAASDWQRLSAINGVKFRHSNPIATPMDMHNSWLMQKQIDGWTYGEVKDQFLKQHPCMVPYDELPPHQQFKDKLFYIIATTLLRQHDLMSIDVGLGSGEG